MKNEILSLLDNIKTKSRILFSYFKMISLIIKWKLHCLNHNYLIKINNEILLLIKKYNLNLFIKIKDDINNKNIEYIKKKPKIKVAFLLSVSDVWPGDTLFSYFENDTKFDPYIVVHPVYNGNENFVKTIYHNTLRFIHDNGYSHIETTNDPSNYNLEWNSIGRPDLIIHLSPYSFQFPKGLNIINLPLCALNAYIPYGFTVISIPSVQYNLPSHQLYWKIFGDSKYYQTMGKKYSDIKGRNIVYSGYTKMDNFISSSDIKEINDYWKISNHNNRNSIIKIIYAPHHSIRRTMPGFSTFDKNYLSIYEYAKNHPDNTSWIIKPHPSLRKEAVRYKLFQNEQEYDKYLDMWNQLPNAKVVLGGDYFNYFKTSDCMILDSGSFIAEYFYVDKPLLLLTRRGQKFNELGLELQKAIYKADGSNINEITNFIENTVHNDVLKPIREEMFNKHLNYLKSNGKLASKYIYDYIIDNLLSS